MTQEVRVTGKMLANINFNRLKAVLLLDFFFVALSSASKKSAYEIFLKLAISLEITGNIQDAAQYYIKYFDIIKHSDNINYISLYRAFGCYHKLKDFNSIIQYSENLSPYDWDKFSGAHEIIGYAYFLASNFSSALRWILMAPLSSDSNKEYEDLLKIVLKNTPKSFEIKDIDLLLIDTCNQVFSSDKRTKILIKWISTRFNLVDITNIITNKNLIIKSSGKCLPYVLIFETEHGSKEKIEFRSRQSLTFDPSILSAYSTILPDCENSPNEDVSEEWLERWSKASIITSHKNPEVTNKAIIALKSLAWSETNNRYINFAANNFPTFPIIQYNIASFFNEQSFAESAEILLRKALVLNPSYTKAWNSYSVSQCIMLKSDKAIQVSQRCICCDPRLASAYTNLSMAYRGAGDTSKAIEASKTALQLDPSDAVTRMGLAFLQLSIGAIEQGFENYLSRWQQKGFPSPKRPFPQREWVNNKISRHEKFLVYMEQGMGDELMYSWFLTYLEEKYPNQILVECDERLVEIFQRSFPRIEVHPRTTPIQQRLFEPDVRWKLPVAHLPHYFTNRLRELIKERWALALSPYVEGYGWLTPDSARLLYWQKYLEKLCNGQKRLIVGVAWRSANLTRPRKLQYVSPEEMVRALPDGALAINLQYVYTPSELAEIQDRCSKRNIIFHTIPDLDLRDDLNEVTNLCSALDALATPLTSTAFMGGALGLPTFVFRSHLSGEIWQQLGTPHLPWLPSIRVFFRDPRKNWDDVLDKVRQQLNMMAEERRIV